MKRIFLVITILWLAQQADAKRNDDVVIMKNGDRLTGEIKRLDRGLLYFSAPYMVDTMTLDWAQVERVESKDQYRVLLLDGTLLQGIVAKSGTQTDGEADVTVTDREHAVRVTRAEVGSVKPIEGNFWHQLTGSVSYGGTYTGGTSNLQSTLSATLGYPSEKWEVQSSADSVINRQSGAKSSGRNEFLTSYLRYLTPKWVAEGTGELLNSQQQDLTLRSSVGGAFGRSFVRSEHAVVRAVGGLVYSKEVYTVDSPQTNNTELLLQVHAEKFRFKTFNWINEASAFPSLTTPGRVRYRATSDLYIELYRNLKWKFSVYENYDTKPPVKAPKNDFGTSTSIGWTF